MAESDNSAVKRVTELFEDCRALHRESYPLSLLDFDRQDLTGRITHGSWAHAKGHFADVYRGDLDDVTVVAVKKLRLPAYSIHSDKVYRATLLRFFREMNIWGALDHTNVTPFLGYTLAGGSLSLISPWYNKGNLVEFLQNSPGASESDLTLDVAEGTQYLHTCRNPLVHGDIKGANILVSEHGIACLADFGISKQIDDMNRQTGFTTTSGVTGTIPWMAPELTRDSALTPSCDIYSCAGVFLEICCPGKTPYHYLRQWALLRAKDTGAPPDLLEYPEMDGKAELWEIMCACWSPVPSKRPRITDLVQSLYTLLKRTPRINQLVSVRPLHNLKNEQKPGSTMKRPRVDSTQSDSSLLEASFKRQKRQRSDSAPEAPAREGYSLSIGDFSSSPSPSPGAGSSDASSSSGSSDADDVSCELTMGQLMDMDLEDIPANNLKQEGDWHAVSNPQATRSLDISLAMTLTHDSTVWCVQFSPDGQSLATGCYRVAHVYDTGTGKKTHILAHENAEWQGKTLEVYSVSFSPDGKLIATGASDQRLRIWDLAAGKIRTIFEGHTKFVSSVAFSPDGSKIVSGSWDGTCRIWNLQTGEAIVLNRIGVECEVNSVAFSPNGSLVAAGCDHKIVRIWDAFIGDLVEELKGHTGLVQSVLFTPDGRNLISGSVDRTVKLWSLESLPEAQPRAATSPKGGIVPLGQHTAIRESGETGSRCIANFLGAKDWVWSVATSRNGSWAVAGSYNGTVAFWDMGNPETPQLMLQGHEDQVTSVDMGPPLTPGTLGGLLATGCVDGSVRIWRYNCV